MVMGCVFDINTVHKTVEKLTFQAFYWSSHSCNICKFVKEGVITSTESFKRRALILSRPNALLVFKSLMALETKSSLIGWGKLMNNSR